MLDASRPVSFAVALLLAGLASAQGLSLDKRGGAIGGPVSFPVQGQPNEPYLVLVDLSEQTTTVAPLGITLAIPGQFVSFSVTAPTFFGTTNGTGGATASAVIPNDPSLQNLVFSLQAIAGSGPFRVSNLVRVTPQLGGTFVPALQNPSVPILGGGTAAAANGEILFVGGSGPVAQRYRSRTEDWELAGATLGVGLFGQSTGLADGRVLFTGGLDLTTGQPTNAAAVYDPATQQTTSLTMGAARAGHGAALMGNGRVLITGGSSAFVLTDPLSLFTGILGSSEIFDPATNTFSPGPNMLEARAFHTASSLPNGQVLIAGGITLLPIVNIPTVSATAYRFNPANNSFGLPAFFSGSRFLHSATALSDGRVLLAGGLTLDLSAFLQSGNLQDLIIGTRSDCQLFSTGLLGFGTFTTVNGLGTGRAGAAIAPLANGAALVAGGFELVIDLTTQTFVLEASPSADLFTPSPNTLTPTGSMAAPRVFPLALPLPDGTVLVVGGGPADAEIYQR